MRQYWEVKSLHSDKIILFRMGDFFEMFHDDAKTAAPLLGIALTSRNKKALDETPMCGVPHHSIAGICNKLLKAGHKVAICDQLEDPKLAKGLVKRGVTRILTPGMVYDSDNLAPDISNYIACFLEVPTSSEGLSQAHLSFADPSSGEAFYFVLSSRAEALNLLNVFPVVELLVEVLDEELSLAPQGPWMLTKVSRHDEAPKELSPAVATLIQYIKTLGGEEALRTMKSFERKQLQSRMRISSTVLRHLEVFNTYRGEKEGSFFHAIDRTKTSSGARLMRQWLSFPMMNLPDIEERQNTIRAWLAKPNELRRIREIMATVGDIERRLGKVSSPQCNARDLQSLSQSLSSAFAAESCAGLKSDETLKAICHAFSEQFLEELPISTKQGGMIKKGFDPELDNWVELATNSQGLLQKMEEEERARTGISSLKIRYNNVFGFYIEITNTHKEKIPENYLRKQTLANAERFCTPELIELEKKVLTAQARRSEIEAGLFASCKDKFLSFSMPILELAQKIAEIDCFTAFAWLALEQNLIAPRFSKTVEGSSLRLRASRHPVVESVVGSGFVANDLELNAGECLLLTGPNMAGKSTLMRQIALVSLLAQVGSFVPASEAELPLFDAIYTRIGASDMLSEGLSTFMVEMKETAQMLSEVTSRSLVVLDEVGRGTSTYDGLALAQSLLEDLVIRRKCITLFATHYHELTELSLEMPTIKNAHMSVVEKNGQIKFLHSLKSGAAGKSYGIQVGRLAGLPSAVTDRAAKILKELEAGSRGLRNKNAQGITPQMSLLELDFSSQDQTTQQKTLDQETERLKLVESLGEKIKSFDVSQKTPLEALIQISQWQNELQ